MNIYFDKEDNIQRLVSTKSGKNSRYDLSKGMHRESVMISIMRLLEQDDKLEAFALTESEEWVNIRKNSNQKYQPLLESSTWFCRMREHEIIFKFDGDKLISTDIEKSFYE